MREFDWITITTDYGLSDGFVAACHGTIARIAPGVRVIDVTHMVTPRDVGRAAAVLAQTVPHLPPAVHVAVVDPGVGTSRRALGIEARHGLLVGPDNGVLLPAADALGGVRRAVALENAAWFAPAVSPTFHGRDVFAPVASRLALGADLADAGSAMEVDALVRLPEPVLVVGEDWMEAEVLTVDRFGNVQLAAPGSVLDGLGSALAVGGMRAARTGTFAAAPKGALIVYVDSADRVAVAINGGRAVIALGVCPGDVLRIAAA